MHSRLLEGHVALVTGSSTGLGKGILFCLADAGAKVVMNYAHNQERAEAAFAELQATGGDGLLIRASAVDEGEVVSMVAEAKKALGTVDIVVPNATPDQPMLPITSSGVCLWTDIECQWGAHALVKSSKQETFQAISNKNLNSNETKRTSQTSERPGRAHGDPGFGSGQRRSHGA